MAERINLITDSYSFEETNRNCEFCNPIDFPGYYEKHQRVADTGDFRDAIITGRACIDGNRAMLGIMDTRYFMGSMGVIVGEKIARLFEQAQNERLPVIMITASGGARMQEGIFSLMQMAKTAAVVHEFSNSGGFYLSILTNPTTGGVSASFAFLGDVILSEPGAVIGFAGKRVIEQTVREKLPDHFQTAEYLFEHGYIDAIVTRKEMKKTISSLLRLHQNLNSREVHNTESAGGLCQTLS